MDIKNTVHLIKKSFYLLAILLASNLNCANRVRSLISAWDVADDARVLTVDRFVPSLIAHLPYVGGGDSDSDEEVEQPRGSDEFSGDEQENLNDRQRNDFAHFKKSFRDSNSDAQRQSILDSLRAFLVNVRETRNGNLAAEIQTFLNNPS